MASAAELRDTVEQLSLRKEELKQQLLDKEVELDEVKDTYRYETTGLVYIFINRPGNITLLLQLLSAL